MPYVPDLSLIPGAAMWGIFTAECQTTGCGGQKRFYFCNGMKLKVGDPLPSGSEDPNFDKCVRCKCKSLIVSKVPDELIPVPPRTGFWKIPNE